jgi:hypothetical protein
MPLLRALHNPAGLVVAGSFRDRKATRNRTHVRVPDIDRRIASVGESPGKVVDRGFPAG